ncbi:translation protein SH3-like domain-containing protein [Gorgonomyces haynaldii]|nr:translation protein SH3-like domain-containing protein [Gorgonomyces haynaldii]
MSVYRGRNLFKKKLQLPKDEIIKRHKLFPGDLVQVVSGKDAGKQGKVLDIIRDRNLIVVENVNMATKHMKPNPFYPHGGRIQVETPFPYSHVQLVDPTLNQPTKTEFIFTRQSQSELEPKKWYRLSKLSNQLIPIPEKEDPFKQLQEGPLDTKPDVVNETTFYPSLNVCPFPPSFMNEMERMRRKNRESQAL